MKGLPLDAFYVDKSKEKPYLSRCKDCQKKRYEEGKAANVDNEKVRKNITRIFG